MLLQIRAHFTRNLIISKDCKYTYRQLVKKKCKHENSIYSTILFHKIYFIFLFMH